MLALLVAAVLLVAATGAGATTSVRLNRDLNLVSFSTDFDVAVTSHGLTPLLGSDLLAVSRLDAADNMLETTIYSGGVASGPEFPIVAGEGYYVEMGADAAVQIDGVVAETVVDLLAGLNLVGFSPVRPGYRASKLLALIEDTGTEPESVASIRRFDPETGKYQTVVRTASGFAGKDFPIRPVRLISSPCVQMSTA